MNAEEKVKEAIKAAKNFDIIIEYLEALDYEGTSQFRSYTVYHGRSRIGPLTYNYDIKRKDFTRCSGHYDPTFTIITKETFIRRFRNYFKFDNFVNWYWNEKKKCDYKKCQLIELIDVPANVKYPRWWYCEEHKKDVGLEFEQSKDFMENYYLKDRARKVYKQRN